MKGITSTAALLSPGHWLCWQQNTPGMLAKASSNTFASCMWKSLTSTNTNFNGPQAEDGNYKKHGFAPWVFRRDSENLPVYWEKHPEYWDMLSQALEEPSANHTSITLSFPLPKYQVIITLWLELLSVSLSGPHMPTSLQQQFLETGYYQLNPMKHSTSSSQGATQSQGHMSKQLGYPQRGDAIVQSAGQKERCPFPLPQKQPVLCNQRAVTPCKRGGKCRRTLTVLRSMGCLIIS